MIKGELEINPFIIAFSNADFKIKLQVFKVLESLKVLYQL